MHHCIVKIRVEFFVNGFDRLYSQALQCSGELFVDFFHALSKRITFRCLCKASFKVIYHRKDFLNNILRSNDIHAGFFFFRTFTEVIKLSHVTLQSVSQIFNLLFQLIVFFLLAKERIFSFGFFIRFLIVFSCTLGFLCGFRSCGCLRRFFYWFCNRFCFRKVFLCFFLYASFFFICF